MSGLPVEHMRGDDGGPLCGARRKWGALCTSSPGAVSCKRCLAKMPPPDRRTVPMFAELACPTCNGVDHGAEVCPQRPAPPPPQGSFGW